MRGRLLAWDRAPEPTPVKAVEALAFSPIRAQALPRVPPHSRIVHQETLRGTVRLLTRALQVRVARACAAAPAARSGGARECLLWSPHRKAAFLKARRSQLHRGNTGRFVHPRAMPKPARDSCNEPCP